ncbi:MAG TPA: flagellar hook-length control protein FliK [Bryobacterales bacterium]|nr:flagellar hook-length control protein FliK [Bryobacterales bacterium]
MAAAAAAWLARPAGGIPPLSSGAVAVTPAASGSPSSPGKMQALTAAEGSTEGPQEGPPTAVPPPGESSPPAALAVFHLDAWLRSAAPPSGATPAAVTLRENFVLPASHLVATAIAATEGAGAAPAPALNAVGGAEAGGTAASTPAKTSGAAGVATSAASAGPPAPAVAPPSAGSGPGLNSDPNAQQKKDGSTPAAARPAASPAPAPEPLPAPEAAHQRETAVALAPPPDKPPADPTASPSVSPNASAPGPVSPAHPEIAGAPPAGPAAPPPAAASAEAPAAQVAKASLRTTADGSQVEIVLRPDPLSRVTVRLVERSGQVQIDVRSSSQPLKSLLAESLPTLLDGMRQRGWDIAAGSGAGGAGQGPASWSAPDRHPEQGRRSKDAPANWWRRGGPNRGAAFSLEDLNNT